jgi:ankyrin repeat protein
VDNYLLTWQGEVTPLLEAASAGNNDVVELLLGYYASIDQGNIDGYTPLIVASLNNHPRVVRTLLAHGAEINVKTKVSLFIS